MPRENAQRQVTILILVLAPADRLAPLPHLHLPPQAVVLQIEMQAAHVKSQLNVNQDLPASITHALEQILSLPLLQTELVKQEYYCRLGFLE